MKRALHAVQSSAHLSHELDHVTQEFRYGWIDAGAAMRHLGVGSSSALYRLINQWRLPCSRLGRLYRFRRCDLDQWMTANQRALASVQRA